MQSRTYDIHLEEKKIVAEIGDLADQADGAVLMRSGDTIVHVACVGKKPTRPDSGFLPLTVEYEERFYARGALLGSQFVRREGRPSEEAVLTARAIDRAIRPLFAPWLREEIQVVATVLSYDPAEEPGYLALIGASLALAISPIPWNGPLGASRITSEGDGLLVAAKKGKIVMLEAGKSERQADDCAPLFEKALAESEKIESWIEKITEGEGAQKRQVSKPPFPATFPELFAREIEPGLSEALDKARTSPNRFKKQGFFEEARRRWTELAKGAAPDTDRNSTELFFEEALRGLVRERTLKGARIDGREKDELRPIEAATGTFGERVHGSGTFYRGATHVASFLTVGPDKDALAVNGMEVAERKHFIHHYNFPPFSGRDGPHGEPQPQVDWPRSACRKGASGNTSTPFRISPYASRGFGSVCLKRIHLDGISVRRIARSSRWRGTGKAHGWDRHRPCRRGWGVRAPH